LQKKLNSLGSKAAPEETTSSARSNPGDWLRIESWDSLGTPVSTSLFLFQNNESDFT
jgi:hypothetical protein